MTTKADCAQKIAAYLADEISHDELLKWTDAALVAEDFPPADGKTLLGVLSELSAGRTPDFLAKVDNYQALLRELGFRLQTRLIAA
jgi:imidazolonepropionase-like amidohydrolase